MNRIKNILKKENSKYFVIGMVILILLFLLTFNHFKISKLEQITITKYSDKMMNYMDTLEKDKLDYYVGYTLTYYYNEENKKEISISEIVNFINHHFHKKVTKKQIQSLGITPYMIDLHITYNSNSKKYSIHIDELSYADIAKKKIVKYELEKIKKKNGKTYEVTYYKYEVKNPYKILNYYTNKEKNKEVEEINLYLTGKSSKKNIMKYITKKNIDKIGEKKEKIKIRYTIKNEDILIDQK